MKVNVIECIPLKNNWEIYKSEYGSEFMSFKINKRIFKIKIDNGRREIEVEIVKGKDDYYYVKVDLNSNHGIYYYECDQISAITSLISRITTKPNIVKEDYINMIFNDLDKIWVDEDEPGYDNIINNMTPSLKEDCRKMFLSFTKIDENKLSNHLTPSCIRSYLYYINRLDFSKISSFKDLISIIFI